MARIRSIKPEFWTDEKVIELPFEARLLFIGMWNFADEFGNMESSPKRLKMQIFPADNIEVESCLEKILLIGLISYYEVLGKKYIHINGFESHQKTNKSASPKVPRPKIENKSDETDKKPVVLDSLDSLDSLNPDSEKSDSVAENQPPKNPPPEYAFTGHTVKLNAKDFNQIKSQYPHVDIFEELSQLDLALRGKKNWWPEMHAKLNYRNKQREKTTQSVNTEAGAI